MKTIKLVMALCMVVVLTTGIFSIVKTSYDSGKIDSGLILQNIEALSEGDDEGYESTLCSTGAPFYGFVESQNGECEVVEHLSDGINGMKGIDRVYIVKYKGCFAKGNGELRGSNYCIPTETGQQSVRECRGLAGHRPFPF